MLSGQFAGNVADFLSFSVPQEEQDFLCLQLPVLQGPT
jgi:hypothetical protein